MSAEIKGLVRGPSGEIVPATVTLKPIPDPIRGSEGSVVTGGPVSVRAAGTRLQPQRWGAGRAQWAGWC